MSRTTVEYDHEADEKADAWFNRFREAFFEMLLTIIMKCPPFRWVANKILDRMDG